MMRLNPLKAKLLQGRPVLGAFVNIPSPAMVEMLGLMGFDFAIIDAEHAAPDLETCEHMVRAAETAGVTPIVRVALNLQQNILRYLDTGVMGVQIPMVNTREEAEQAVLSVFYPPKGQRGLAGVRANRYGVGTSLTDYVAQANRELLCILQIETTRAMANAREIAAVDGVDMVFIGPTDLSSSMGLPGQPTHPDVLNAIEQVAKLAAAAGKPSGTIARDAAAYEHWRRAGVQYLCTGVTNFVAQAGQAYLSGCREREAALDGPGSRS
jgi:4-hydroxy-2-oxoheptanedioate aldolase